MDDATNLDVESTAFNKFLGVFVTLPGDDDESKVLTRVKDRKRYHDGALIGKTHSNPILNIAVYNVETPDGYHQEYNANVISENLWNQVDDDGYNYDNLYEIIGHRKMMMPLMKQMASMKLRLVPKGDSLRQKVGTSKSSWHQEILHLLH